METPPKTNVEDYEFDPNGSTEEQLKDSLAADSLSKVNKKDNNWGHTVDESPEEGLVPEDPEKIRDGIQKIEENEKNYYKKQQEKDPFFEGATMYDKRDVKPAYPRERLAATKEELAPINQVEFIGGNRERLQEVYEEAMELRNRVKDPGNPRFRLMSVAAADLERIEQPVDTTERISKNNEEIAKAIKAAVGEEDEYSGDTGAGVQEYISETLIGGDAESVFIGVTGTIVSGNGQIGEKSDTYKNLVVLRWIKNNVNHVIAFSPREEAAIYTLVDGDMNEDWRTKFLRAGAIECKERDEIDVTNHDRDEFYLHERTMEKVVDRIVKAETDIANSSATSHEKSARILESAADTKRHLAHLDKYMDSKEPQIDRSEVKASEKESDASIENENK